MKRVVIIGGGYSGIYALRELIKNENIHITLIDKHTYHNLQPEVYDFIANKANIADVTIDLTTLCLGFDHPFLEYKNLNISNIDFQSQILYSKEDETLSYDYLIIAAGSRTFFPESIKGLKNTDDIKKLHKAIYFKQSFENQIFNKIQDEAKKCDKTHIAVIGAGLSGVEIASEMAYYSQELLKRGSFACKNIEISLISSSSTILPGFNKKLMRMAHNRLKELNIHIITNTKMQSADKEYLYLSNGTKIIYSFIVFTGGIEPSNMATSLEVAKNEKGQLLVNEYLQLTDYQNVFAIGDIANIKNPKGETMPQNVTVARDSGIIAGKNILALIKDKALKKCDPRLEGILIALGGKYAVCDLYGIVKFKGYLAYVVKQFAFFAYKFPLLKYIKNGYKKLHNLH